jgi:hypothetical protein
LKNKARCFSNQLIARLKLTQHLQGCNVGNTAHANPKVILPKPPTLRAPPGFPTGNSVFAPGVAIGVRDRCQQVLLQNAAFRGLQSPHMPLPPPPSAVMEPPMNVTRFHNQRAGPIGLGLASQYGVPTPRHPPQDPTQGYNFNQRIQFQRSTGQHGGPTHPSVPASPARNLLDPRYPQHAGPSDPRLAPKSRQGLLGHVGMAVSTWPGSPAGHGRSPLLPASNSHAGEQSRL